MKSKVQAIIIDSMNLGEADKLVTFFSRERGRLQGTARNARKSFKRFGAGLELFTHAGLQLFEREHQELVRIESADIMFQPIEISTDLRRMSTGSVMLELVKEFAPPGERNIPVFHLLADTLRILNESDVPHFLLRIFEIKLLSLLGYQPRLDHCLSCGGTAKRQMIFLTMKGGVLCPDCMASSGGDQVRLSSGAIGFYYQVLRMDLSKISRLKPSVEIMEELDSAFAAHTFHILGKRLRTMAFLTHCKMIM